jgi:hypothetical protein
MRDGYISIEELQAATEATNPDTEDLYGKVKTLIDSGLTLAQAHIWIADQQPPLRKPVVSFSSWAAHSSPRSGRVA